MGSYVSLADRNAIEAEMPWAERDVAKTIYELISATARRHAANPAVSFQLTSGRDDPAKTLSWTDFHARVTQCANLLRSLGIGPGDVVAYVLPNALETAEVLVAGMVAGVVNPINPLLEPEQIAAILRESKAKVVVTLKSFPRTDVGQKVAAAVAEAPGVETVLEVDLAHYLPVPKRWIVPLIRPKQVIRHRARVLDYTRARDGQRGDALGFADPPEDRVAALFHTGGTTGMPKLACHAVSGLVYNGWLGASLLFTAQDVILCPLPLFHVFAAHPILMSVLSSGAHVVLPTPAGYRGEGVFDNFWKLVERWRVSFMVTVPTAIAMLMQRPVDADVSSLRLAFSGSAPLPVELFHRFETATGVTICEGYGLTEATCLVSVNPPEGAKKIGSVGLPFPYTHVRILRFDSDGHVVRDCGPDEVGEICVSSPGVRPGATYTDPMRHRMLYAEGLYLRTGDLGRLDPDGYLFITGRAKDLIIRGGHNIDPATIEEALAGHPAVAVVGAIGQPDAVAGELPCAYVELCAGAEVTVEQMMDYARTHIHERAAVPKHLEILAELPKTAVGKVFKPDLRKRAIARVFGAALAEAGVPVRLVDVVEDKRRGLIARLERTGAPLDPGAVEAVLGAFPGGWDWMPGETARSAAAE